MFGVIIISGFVWALYPLLRGKITYVPWILLLSVGLVSCQPYDVPEYLEISPNETAFLVPLEDGAKNQAQFDSEAYLEKSKVAAKRVQIPHRWVQTGRSSLDGKYLPTHTLIKVNRAPITREWTSEGTRGTSSLNQAIYTESKDSVEFSMGFSATGYVSPEDTAKFLFLSPSGNLQNVMDSEVRNRIQSAVTEFAAGYNLEELRGKKKEIIEAIRQDVIPFFKTRGVTLTTIGLASGMNYSNKEIQDSIDKVFQAQQLKEISKAQLDAQADVNKKIELEADAQSAAKLKIAKAEAESIKILNEAAGTGNSNAVYLKAIEKWDGKTPSFMGGPVPNMFIK